MVLQALVDGLLSAAIYLPLALGLALIFGVLGVVNFAHAEIFSVLLFIAYGIYRPGMPVYLLIPIMIVVAAAFAVGIHLGLVRPLLRKSPEAHIVITLSLTVLIQGLMLMTVSSTPRSISTSLDTSTFNFGDVTVRYTYLIAAVAGLLFTVLVDRVLMKTTLGAKLRATAHDSQMASVMGINTERVALIATVLGIAALGLSAATMLPFVVVDPSLGQRYILPIFSIVILAGLGSTRGIFLGALVYSLLDAFSAATLSIALANTVPLLAIAGLIIVRPNGLLRGRQTI